MEDVRQIFSLLLGALVVGFLVFVGITSSKMDKALKIAETKKKSDARETAAKAIEAQVELAEQASRLLPDVEGAIDLLKTQYGWRELVETIGVRGRQLELLRSLPSFGTENVHLPNMQADQYSNDEHRVARRINSITTPADDVGFWGDDAFAQEPTAAMLKDLVTAGFVSVAKPITKNARDFECTLTVDGRALAKLDARFYRDCDERHLLWSPPPAQSVLIVRSVLQGCIRVTREEDE
ncbi:hypothetical protein [Variovorax sp. PBL-E5]|uniref:hypothetical protein n=1 Tax=Variovorax sp. PBL-E5 TaxID=434014 RepID=UPI00131704EF|nr:hypothetical protein [Variovorax sp. PBL-E5]VTU29832.1 hypothetical protein E5CHR_02891 [Variovorax sp. PBL-E5]